MEQSEKGQLLEVSAIKVAYEKKVGHTIGGSQIYYLLARHGFRKVMPRSQHPNKASEEAIEASKNHLTTNQLFRDLNRGTVRLMFQNEAGFGRINKPKYCWCRKEFRPSVPCHHIREYRYAYGAVEPSQGKVFP